MINRSMGTWRNHLWLASLLNACRWFRSRPSCNLATSVKWLMYAGLLLYSMEFDSSVRIWDWRAHIGISVPGLTESAVQGGFIAVCLLASIIFIEPWLPTCLRQQLCFARKIPPFTIVGGALSLAACAFGMLPIILASIDWWGGGLFALWGLLLLLALLVRWLIEVCNALWQAARFCLTAAPGRPAQGTMSHG